MKFIQYTRYGTSIVFSVDRGTHVAVRVVRKRGTYLRQNTFPVIRSEMFSVHRVLTYKP